MLALALAAAVAVSGISAAPAQGPGESVRVAFVDKDAERIGTMPITRRKNRKPRSVMSLELGPLLAGDRLEGTSEVEVSVCLKPAPHTHDPSGRCIGKEYGYNPRVQAKIVLAPEAGAAGAKQTMAFNNPDSLSCSQKQPNRNHHCVLVIDDGVLRVDDVGDLPCGPSKCRANLVMTAYHRDARKGHKLVIGSDTSSGGINQDKGRLDVTRFRDGADRVEPKSTGARTRNRLPIAPEDRDVIEKVIYSIPLNDLTAGEQLVMAGKVVAKIGQHPYNTFMATKVILSKGPNSVDKGGLFKIVGRHPELGKTNGFNCTQGRSAHPDPCTARKVGSVEVVGTTHQTLYMNLVTGMNAQLFGDRHRPGDDAKILDSGFLKVYRYSD